MLMPSISLQQTWKYPQRPLIPFMWPLSAMETDVGPLREGFRVRRDTVQARRRREA